MPTSEPEPGADTAVVNHVGQCVADIGRAERFYVELLGFEVDRRLDVPDEAAGPLLGVAPPVGLSATYLRKGDFQLELLAYDRPGNPPFRPRVLNEPGLTHLSMSVDDLDATVDRVEALGGEIVTRLPFAAFVRDPDGQLLELLPMSFRRGRP
ncbi:MAG TPA: VOC family protein [Acidimicrobiales bacterium]|nr:VOC family protein [Acidimicrobiales bacterium]